MAALEWLREHAQELGGSARALALGGASAGANIVLAVALRLRDETLPLPAQLVLFYGVYGVDRNTESDCLFGTPEFSGPLTNMELFYTSYAGSPEQRRDPLVAPLLADLKGLPPTFLNAAGIDPLRDDSRRLRDRLQQSGVPVSYLEYPGVLHGFTQFTLTSATARKAQSDAGVAIREALADVARHGQTCLALQQAGLETNGDGMTAVACSQLFEQVAEVEANGRCGDRHGVGNLGVAMAAGEAFENGNFALTQVGKHRLRQQHTHQCLIQHRAQGAQNQWCALTALVQ